MQRLTVISQIKRKCFRQCSYISRNSLPGLEETIIEYEDQPDFMVKFGKAYITFFMNKPQYFHFLFGKGSPQVDFSPGAKAGYKLSVYIINNDAK